MRGGGLAGAAIAALLPLASPAQPYPAKTVRILVGFAPGVGTDIMAYRNLGYDIERDFAPITVVSEESNVFAAQEFTKFIAAGTPRYAKIVKDASIPPQ